MIHTRHTVMAGTRHTTTHRLLLPGRQRHCAEHPHLEDAQGGPGGFLVTVLVADCRQRETNAYTTHEWVRCRRKWGCGTGFGVHKQTSGGGGSEIVRIATMLRRGCRSCPDHSELMLSRQRLCASFPKMAAVCNARVCVICGGPSLQCACPPLSFGLLLTCCMIACGISDINYRQQYRLGELAPQITSTSHLDNRRPVQNMVRVCAYGGSVPCPSP